MGNPAVNRQSLEALPEAAVGYAVEGDTIFIQTGKQVLDGEEIAPGIVVLYDEEDGNDVVGITIMGAEGVLKPFVDAILTKYGQSGAGADVKKVVAANGFMPLDFYYFSRAQ